MSGIAALALLVTAAGFEAPKAAQAASSLSITPLTWHVVGVRSNVGPSKPGPDRFPVGVRVCNSSASGTTTASNVNTRFAFEGTGNSSQAGFSLDGNVSTDALGDLAPGVCADSYFNVILQQSSSVRGNFRQYFVEACEGGSCSGTGTSPSSNTAAQYPPASGTGSTRGLYIERLVSQNRNVTRRVSGPGGCNYDYTQCDPVPTDLKVGQTYTFKLYASTSTAYEQLESFITFPRSTFRIESISSVYQTPAGRTIDRPWSNACGWNPDYDAASDLTCGFSPPADFQPTGKAGRNVVTTYKVKVIGTGSTDLTTLIYDFSGSSFHYNADFGTSIGTFVSKFPLNATVTGAGSVTSSPSGISCGTAGANCSASYSSGTSVTLTASPASGQTFSGWGGACSGTASTCTVTMSQARDVTAAFTGSSSFPLSVAVQGSGTVTSDSGGVDCTSSGGSNCLKSYSSGSSVTLSATPSAGWNFSGWSGACSNSSGTCTVTMSQAREVTALFEPAPVVTRTLTVTGLPVNADGETLPPTGGTITSAATGGGGIDLNCGAFCLGEYVNGTSVTVTATPASGYKLASWGGACSSATISATPTAAQTCTVPMNQNQNVSANFVSTAVTTTYNLTSATTLDNTVSTSAGQVTSNVGGISCGPTTTDCTKSFLQGTQVTLTATPAAGKKFNGWETSTGASFDGCQNEVDPTTSTTCGVIVDAAKTVRADFSTIPNFYLQVNIAGNGSGGVKTSSGSDVNCVSGLAGTSTECSETFGSSTSVTLTATPDPGSTFDGFTSSNCPGTVGGSGTTCSVTVSEARTVDANFTLIELRKLTAQKSGTGEGDLAASVGGSPVSDLACDASCRAAKEKTFNKGTTVVLSVTPQAGSRFRGWKELDGTATDACSENPATSTTCTVTLSDARSLVADLSAVKTLSGSKTGSGDGSLTTSNTNWAGGKVNCPAGTASCSADYDQGDVVTLSATPDSGSRFAGWSGACSASSGDCTVTMDAARSVTAQFIAVRQLSVDKTGNGKGSVAGAIGGVTDSDLGCGLACSGQKQKTFDKDTVVALTATPGASGDDYSRFAGWKKTDGTTFDGCGLGENADTSTTCTVTLSQARSVVAKFVAIRNLSGSKTGSGDGSLTTSNTNWAGGKVNCPAGTASCSADYDQGDVVTLSATPDSGSRFAGWSGACSASSGDCTVTMDAARSVTAQFIAIKQLTVSKYGGAGGDGKGSVAGIVGGSPDPAIDCGVDCSTQKQKSYDLNTTVKLTAAPGTGDDDLSTFEGWKSSAGGPAYTGCAEGSSGTSVDCTVTLSEARSLVAEFKAIRKVNIGKSGSGTGTFSGKVGGPSGSSDPDLDCDAGCGSNKEKTYDKGTVVTLTATPTGTSTFGGWKNADGSAFTGCSEDSTGAGTACTVTLSQVRVLRAKFNSATVVRKQLEVEKGGNGSGGVTGTVDGNPDSDIGCDTNCSAKKNKDLDESSTVVLTATPVASGDNRSRFAGWKQADGTTPASECQEPSPSTSTTCTLSMSVARSVIARFVLVKALTVSKQVNGSASGAGGSVTSNVGGISCGYSGTPCTDEEKDFDLDGTATSVTLTATPADADQFRFAGWSGACSGSSGTCAVTMNQARAVTANFVKVRKLTVTKQVNGASNGSGGTVTASRGGNDVPGGIDCGFSGTPCIGESDRFDFDDGSGTGVTLTASPADPDLFRFAGWSGACSGSSESCSVTMDAARDVAANFIPVRKLTVRKTVRDTLSGAGGTVTSDVGGIDCGPGGSGCQSASRRYDLGNTPTPVTLTATVADAELYRFDGWKQTDGNPFAGCSGTGTCTVTMDSAREVDARFVPVRRLTVDKSGSGVGATAAKVGSSTDSEFDCGNSCSSQKTKRFDQDTVVELTATPEPSGSDRSRFAGWKTTGGGAFAGCSEGSTGLGASCTVTLSDARSVVADFKKIKLLSASTSGAGSVSTSSANWESKRVDCGTGVTSPDCAVDYDQGTNVTLGAQPKTTGTNRTRFRGWKKPDGSQFDGCAENPDSSSTCTVTMSDARNVRADFSIIQPLTVEIERIGSGAGAVTTGNRNWLNEKVDCGDGVSSPECQVDYDDGETVTLTAAPEAGSNFLGWTDISTSGTGVRSRSRSSVTAAPSGCETTDPCTVTLNQARFVRATFQREPAPTPDAPQEPEKPAEPDAPTDNRTTLSLKVKVDDNRLTGRESAVQTVTVKNTGPNSSEATWVWCWICKRMVAVRSVGAVVSRRSSTGPTIASRPRLGWKLGSLKPGESRKVRVRVAALRGARRGSTSCPAATVASNAPRVQRTVRFILFPRVGSRPFQPTG